MTETTPGLFKEARFEDLLKSMNYLLVDDKLLFYNHETETFVIADVSPQTQYTAQMYMQLPEGAPFELIHNKLIFMPAPTIDHQDIIGNIHLIVTPYVKKNKIGVTLISPMDVHLDEKTVVQPDYLFVSIRRSSIIQKWIFGAPDFIVEVLSTNKKHDRETKMRLYEEHNVLEYWIVSPSERLIEVYHNEKLKMRLAQTAQKGDSIKSTAIKGLVVEVNEVFDI